MKFVDRLLFKATGRKLLVFVVASAFLAAVTIGGIAVEKGLTALGGKAE